MFCCTAGPQQHCDRESFYSARVVYLDGGQRAKSGLIQGVGAAHIHDDILGIEPDPAPTKCQSSA